MSLFLEFLRASFAGKKVAILGYGVEGKSSFKWLAKLPEVQLRIGDQHLQEDLEVPTFRGENWLKACEGVDFVVRSPGIHPQKILDAHFVTRDQITGQVEMLLSFARERVLGITGTLGKGSTCALLDFILTRAKVPHALGGNFGIPAWDIADLNGYLILELSSFQTYLLRESPKYVGIVETTSEHLDWHEDETDYLNAKSRLVHFQREEDVLYYLGNSVGVQHIVQKSFVKDKTDVTFPTKKGFWYDGSHLRWPGGELRTEQCKMPGQHQMINRAIAGNLALELGVSYEEIVESLKEFPGLPMRLEYKGQHRGLYFYNDSYATRPDATIGAIKSMSTPFALILGGSEKYADFVLLVEEVLLTSHLHFIALIGETAGRLQKELLAAKVPAKIEVFKNLEEAFSQAIIQPKIENVLLSPACASFGLFRNYKHRGEVFNELVEGLGSSQ